MDKSNIKELPEAESLEISSIELITDNEKTYNLIDIIPSNGRIKTTAFTVKEICDRLENGSICRDNLLQRLENQWNKSKKSYLILSALDERPLGTIIITGKGMSVNKLYERQSLLDGLQRTTTFLLFTRDRFRLAKDLPPVMCSFKSEDGEVITKAINVSGLRFSELPVMFQQRILETKIDVNIYNGFTDKELDNIVYCVNNGAPFKPMQKLRTVIGSEMMKHIQPICSCTFWEKTPKITSKNDNILGCIIRTLMLYTEWDSKCLSVSEMNRFAKKFNANNKKNVEAVKEVENLFNTFNDTIHKKIKGFDEDYSFLTPCTIPHFLMNFSKFQDMEDVKMSDYTAFLNDFLESGEPSEKFIGSYTEFVNLCRSGSGGGMYSAETVEDRQCMLDDALDGYIEYIRIHRNNNG